MSKCELCGKDKENEQNDYCDDCEAYDNDPANSNYPNMYINGRKITDNREKEYYLKQI